MGENHGKESTTCEWIFHQLAAKNLNVNAVQRSIASIIQGFWYFTEKKAKFRGIFRGKFAGKSADFAGFSRGKQVEIRKKIGRFRWGLVAKSQISKDFQGQIRGKIGRFRGIFAGKTSQNSQKNRPISLGFSGKKSTFEGFSGANSQKNRPISQEISEGNFAKKQSIKNNRFRWIFSGKFR